jgi:transposase
VVPDNLKSGVHRASFYDPEINRSYGMMASHYGVGILPARPRKPRDKAKVEAGVRFAQTYMRRGFPSLALQVQEVLRKDPLSGHLFVFRGRRSDLVKMIWHDGQGACLFTKRLERGRFIWPSVAGESVTISPAQLSYLLSGIDWRNPQETQRPTRVG